MVSVRWVVAHFRGSWTLVKPKIFSNNENKERIKLEDINVIITSPSEKTHPFSAGLCIFSAEPLRDVKTKTI